MDIKKSTNKVPLLTKRKSYISEQKRTQQINKDYHK